MLLGELHKPLHAAIKAKRLGGEPGGARSRLLAEGEGWSLLDIICSSGPGDRAFEERHGQLSISFVLAGSFGYRSTLGRALLVPGATLLGTAGACFECGHEHGAGDRCLSIHFAPELVEEANASLGRATRFGRAYLPPGRSVAPVFTRAAEFLSGGSDAEAMVLNTLRRICKIAGDSAASLVLSPADERRVTGVARWLADRYAEPVSLAELAVMSGLSRFHFLRVFKRTVGTTPHQYVVMLRLSAAAAELKKTRKPVTTIALEAGFDDLSNFVRTFRRQFGTSPSVFRN